eukprot:TRINITY_DN5548_c0_g4_i1.p1 TRINITY_DN5548_c0_g4~~TRINITY_DN5548_c0_g4_i1.p1  ORF type:complete len:2708 (+),score=590.19 TRINITY_DN5548_c0_g4_i1:544-8124(+)
MQLLPDPVQRRQCAAAAAERGQEWGELPWIDRIQLAAAWTPKLPEPAGEEAECLSPPIGGPSPVLFDCLGTAIKKHASATFEDEEQHQVLREVTCGCLARGNPLRRAFIAAIRWPHFDTVVLSVLLLNVAGMAASDPTLTRDERESDPFQSFLRLFDLACLVFFSLEIIVRCMALGWAQGPFEEPGFWTDSWNRFDFIVVVLSWLGTAIELVGFQGSTKGVQAVRAFRAAKSLKAVKSLHGVRAIITALARSLGLIGSTVWLFLFFFFTFAVVAVEFYKESMSRQCIVSAEFARTPAPREDPPEQQRSSSSPEALGGMSWEGRDLFGGVWCAQKEKSFGNKCLEPVHECAVIDAPYGGHAHMDHIGAVSLVQLQIVTLDGWSLYLYALGSAEHWVWTLGYFILMIITLTFIVLNLFLAVMHTTFVNVRKEAESSGGPPAGGGAIGEEVRLVQGETELDAGRRSSEVSSVTRLIELEKVEPCFLAPLRRVQPCVTAIVAHGRFAVFINICILITVGMQTYEASGVTISDDTARRLCFIEFGLTLIFLVELLLKMIHFGTPLAFVVKDVWNVFDLLLVAVSVTGFVGDLPLCSSQPEASLTFLRAFRLFRVFRLIKSERLAGLRRLLSATVAGLQPTVNVLLLTMFTITIFAIVGMNIFGGKYDAHKGPNPKLAGGFNDATWLSIINRLNFDNFPSAVAVLFQIMTGDSWTAFMWYSMHVDIPWPRVTSVVFFVVVYFLLGTVIVSLYTVVILENFELSAEEKRLAATRLRRLLERMEELRSNRMQGALAEITANRKQQMKDSRKDKTDRWQLAAVVGQRAPSVTVWDRSAPDAAMLSLANHEVCENEFYEVVLDMASFVGREGISLSAFTEDLGTEMEARHGFYACYYDSLVGVLVSSVADNIYFLQLKGVEGHIADALDIPRARVKGKLQEWVQDYPGESLQGSLEAGAGSVLDEIRLLEMYARGGIFREQRDTWTKLDQKRKCLSGDENAAASVIQSLFISSITRGKMTAEMELLKTEYKNRELMMDEQHTAWHALLARSGAVVWHVLPPLQHKYSSSAAATARASISAQDEVAPQVYFKRQRDYAAQHRTAEGLNVQLIAETYPSPLEALGPDWKPTLREALDAVLQGNFVVAAHMLAVLAPQEGVPPPGLEMAFSRTEQYAVTTLGIDEKAFRDIYLREAFSLSMLAERSRAQSQPPPAARRPLLLPPADLAEVPAEAAAKLAGGLCTDCMDCADSVAREGQSNTVRNTVYSFTMVRYLSMRPDSTEAGGGDRPRGPSRSHTGIITVERAAASKANLTNALHGARLPPHPPPPPVVTLIAASPEPAGDDACFSESGSGSYSSDSQDEWAEELRNRIASLEARLVRTQKEVAEKDRQIAELRTALERAGSPPETSPAASPVGLQRGSKNLSTSGGMGKKQVSVESRGLGDSVNALRKPPSILLNASGQSQPGRRRLSSVVSPLSAVSLQAPQRWTSRGRITQQPSVEIQCEATAANSAHGSDGHLSSNATPTSRSFSTKPSVSEKGTLVSDGPSKWFGVRRPKAKNLCDLVNAEVRRTSIRLEPAGPFSPLATRGALFSSSPHGPRGGSLWAPLTPKRSMQRRTTLKSQLGAIDIITKEASHLSYEQHATSSKDGEESRVQSHTVYEIQSGQGDVEARTPGGDDTPDLDRRMLYGEPPRSLWVFSRRSAVRRFCAATCSSRLFQSATVIIVVVSSITPLFQPLREAWNSSPEQPAWVFVTETAFLAFFGLEALIKIIACTFYADGETSYIASHWNKLDFFIFLAQVAALSRPESKSLMLARAARPLRFVGRLEGLQAVLDALLASASTFANFFILGVLYLYIVGLMGYTLFHDRFSYCTNPGWTGGEDWRDCKGETEVSVDGVTYLVPAAWVPARATFDTIQAAIATVAEVASLSSWTEHAYRAMDVNGVGKHPRMNASPYMLVYFVFIIVSVSWFFVNMMIGVIITNINTHRGTEILNDVQQEWVILQSAIGMLEVPVRPKCPDQSPLRRLCFKVAESRCFGYIVMLVIFVNVAMMAASHRTQPDAFTDTTQLLNYIFIFFFTGEMIIKILAYGRLYFHDRWNRFDCVTTSGSLAAAVIHLFMSDVNLTAVSVTRILRIARIFRLVRRFDGIATMFNTLIVSLPQILNISFMLILTVYVYCVCGMSFFAHIRHQLHLNSSANFRSFTSSLSIVFRMITLDDWNRVMRDVAIRPPDCTFTDTWDDCGSRWVYLYFFSFSVIASYIFLNLVIAVILDNFSHTFSQERQFVTMEDKQKFADVWMHMDPDSTGQIRRGQIGELVVRLHAAGCGIVTHGLVHPVLHFLRFKALLYELDVYRYERNTAEKQRQGRSQRSVLLVSTPRSTFHEVLGALCKALYGYPALSLHDLSILESREVLWEVILGTLVLRRCCARQQGLKEAAEEMRGDVRWDRLRDCRARLLDEASRRLRQQQRLVQAVYSVYARERFMNNDVLAGGGDGDAWAEELARVPEEGAWSAVNLAISYSPPMRRGYLQDRCATAASPVK